MANVSIEANIDLSEFYDAFDANMREAGEEILAEVKAKCPVRTGFMRSTIAGQADKDGVDISVGASYAPYTELRTHWFSKCLPIVSSIIMRIGG